MSAIVRPSKLPFEDWSAVAHRRTRTASGLEVALLPLPHLHTVSVVLGIRVGSRFETPGKNGISHLLEHMLFRGNERYPTPHAFNLAIEEFGSTLSAATSAEMTAYSLDLLPEHLEHGLSVLATLFGRPTLSNLELEKRVVQEEILEALDEDGRDIDPDNRLHAALFGQHPLALKVEGERDAVERLDEDALRDWHARHYVARNAVLTVVGAFDQAEAEAAVHRTFADIRPGERVDPQPFVRVRPASAFSYTPNSGSQTDVRIAFTSVGERDESVATMRMLSRLLDDGMSTRLFRTLVEDRGLVYESFGTFDAYEDVGLFAIGASALHRNAPEVVRTALSLFASLREQPIEAAELEKAKTRARCSLRMSLDAADAIAETLAEEVLLGCELDYARRWQRIERVDETLLRAAAEATLRPENLHVVAVGKLDAAARREMKRIAEGWKTGRESR